MLRVAAKAVARACPEAIFKSAANQRMDSLSLPTVRFWALIPCAGSGSRAGGDLPKQYRCLAGQPMVLHTLAAFTAVPRLEATLVVLAPEDAYFDALVDGACLSKATPVPASESVTLQGPQPWHVARCGGNTRAQSVVQGLAYLRTLGAQPQDWVLVHDAARCLVTPAQIEGLVQACERDSVGGMLALKLPDTLKQEHQGRVAATLERSDKWLAQTPQMFRLELLQRALQEVGLQVTDESSAIEALGLAPLLVQGSAQNFKVTYPEDFALAEAVLLARKTITART